MNPVDGLGPSFILVSDPPMKVNWTGHETFSHRDGEDV